MKKLAVAFALMVLSMAIFLPFSLVNAQTSGYTIQEVNHKVQVLYSGQVLIIENIILSGQVPGTFELGLPYKYASSVLEGMAFDSNYNLLPVALGVQLQDQSGFYGAIVTLPAGTSNNFTVVFVLSNAVLALESTGFKLDFPAYLGYTQTVGQYSTIMASPNGSSIVGIDKLDGVVNASTYSKQNLAAFTYSPAIATFSSPYGYLQKISIPTLNRQITIGASGDVICTDTYRIANNSTSSFVSLLINLPVGASNVVARDQFGRVLSYSVHESTSSVLLENVTLALAIGAGESGLITFDYSLPNVSHQGSRYTLNLDMFANFNYYVDEASVTITPPEGATIVAPTLSEIGSRTNLARNAFQEVLTVSSEGVSYIDSTLPSEDVLNVAYDYNLLWVAFRPTSWIWAIVVIGVVVLAIWKRPKGKAAAPRIGVPTVVGKVALSPEHIKDFVEAYEEKGRVTQELRGLSSRTARQNSKTTLQSTTQDN